MRVLLIWLLSTSLAMAQPMRHNQVHPSKPHKHLAAQRLVVHHGRVGVASWYGPGFYGRRTASGAVYTGREFTAAYNKATIGKRMRVTNLQNHRSVVVLVNDTGAFARKYHRRIDLSPAAAQSLDMLHAGLAKVRIVPVAD